MEKVARSMVYKRISLVLIVFTIAILCLKISLSPSVFKMGYTVDFRSRKWPDSLGKDSYELSNGNANNSYNLEDSLNKKQRPIRPPSTSVTTTFSIRNITNLLKTFETDGRDSSPKNTESEITYYKKNLENEIDNVKKNTIITNVKDSNARKMNSSKKHILVIHPNDTDKKKIVSGKYVPEDLMNEGPFQFLKNYKNPCWIPAQRNTTDTAIRCLPYFYLIGAPKSGTSDMHRRLVEHQDISKLVIKEPHWLTRKHFYSLGGRKVRSGLADYLRYFTYASREIYMKRDASGYHSKIFGDCSASTLWDNDYWTILPEFSNLTEPKYTNADYVHHLNPNAKIIAMLRNPVDRLYSDYLYFQHGSPELFHKGVVNIINETRRCLKTNSLRHCMYTPPKYHSYIKIRIRIGVYHLHLKEYFRVFPVEQVMVIKLEDFSNRTAAYMQKVFAFLEMPELPMKDLERIANPKKHANSRRTRDKKAGEMLPKTRKMLEEFYRPHNELLTELLGEQFNYNRDTVH